LNDPLIEAIASFLTKLRDVSWDGRDPSLSSKDFSSPQFTTRISHIPLSILCETNLLRFFSAILTLSWRSEYFKLFSDDQKRSDEQTFFVLGVRRDALVVDTVDAIETAGKEELHRRLAVIFRGKDGIDDGGVSREYFHLLVSQLFNPDYGMFRVVLDRFYWFNTDSIEDVRMFGTLGTIVALAVYNHITLPIRFPLILYKKLIGRQILLSDIKELDPVVADNIARVVEMGERGEDLSDLSLTFSVTVEQFGAFREIPLIENGENVDVTKDNVKRYEKAWVAWKAHKSVENQFRAFSHGFFRLFPETFKALFAPDELDILVSGEEVLDWNDLEKNARYSDGYARNSASVKAFWAIFKEFSNEQKLRFLQFTTGSDRAPLGGLSRVRITIQRMGDPSKLPTSHTCFSIFGLPDYRNKILMKKKIEFALAETEGFGLK
jgi:ubiquitin-protein ligase E3 A